MVVVVAVAAETAGAVDVDGAERPDMARYVERNRINEVCAVISGRERLRSMQYSATVAVGWLGVPGCWWGRAG